MRYLFGCAFGAALLATAATAQDFTMKLSSPTNNDANLRWMQSFEEKVEQRSDGRIDVQLYPANQLGQIPATVEGVTFGTIEATLPSSGFFIGLDPRFEIFDLPGLFQDIDHAQRALADPELIARYTDFGAPAGLRTIGVYANAPMALVSKTPVTKPEDMNGMKLRVAGQAMLQSKPFQKYGASPVSMALGETLPGLQTGTIDGMLASIPVYTTFKFYDVAEHMTILPETFLIVAIVANADFLTKIGPDLEAVVMQAAREASDAANDWTDAELANQKAIWTENGGTIHEWNDADSAAWLSTIAQVLPDAISANPALDVELSAFLPVAKRHAQP